jgi:hypothetical protein
LARTEIKEFPFVSGQNEAIDAKVLPDGLLTRAKNVRLRKDARWGVRADFDAIGNDTSGSNDFTPRDLISFGDRLCALGDASGISGETALWDIFDYTGTTPSEWVASAAAVPLSTPYVLSDATNLRTIGAYTPVIIQSVATPIRTDCAAGGGVVCSAYSQGSTCYFSFIRASTGATVYETSLDGDRPRVVAVGSTFFLLSFDPAAGLKLSKYNPTTDAAAVALTAPTTSALNCYDVVPNRALTGFWVVFNTTTPTTRIVPYNSSGTAGTAIVGPASAFAHLTAVETANRIHLVTVTSAPQGDLRSYTLAGALSTGPTTFSATPDNAQPAAVDATYNGTEQLNIYWNQTVIRNLLYNATTHASSGSTSPLGGGVLGAKPIMGGTPNYHAMVGIVVNDGSFYSTALISDVPTESTFPPAVVSAYTNKFAGTLVPVNHLPKISKDASTGKYYWPTITIDDQSVPRPGLTEFDYLSSSRRQTAQIGGLLYIGGGAVSVYDTRLLYHAGVFKKPRITAAVASNSTGTLPSATTLLASVSVEARDALGNLIQGDISDVSSVTMGGADDTITLTLDTTFGTAPGGATVGYRSVSGVSQLRRAEFTTNSTLVFLASDATVRANGIIYTQAGRGALSGTLPHEAPLPADYVWKFGDRLITASADQAQVSKSIFPGEQVNWSGAVGFTIPKISEQITGIAALDQRGLIFTSDRIYAFSGEGPNDLGEGRFSEPLPVPTSTGLSDWRSLVETPLGLFFQGSNGQLWLLPRDSSAPVWIGQPVRDTLVAFPVVTSATLVTEEQLVSFTCNNSGGTDGRIVSYDLRANTWIVDEFASSTPLAAACSYQQRLAILSSGVVYTEKTSLTPNTFIEHGLTTGDIKPFGGTGWGKICSVDLIGEYRGDCDLYLRVSYDSGKSFTTLTKIHQLRSTSYAAGDIVRVSWDPLRRKAERIRLEFTAKTPGSATEGFVFNGYALELLGDVRGASRKAAAQRG